MTRPCQSNLSIALACPAKPIRFFPLFALSTYKGPFNKDQCTLLSYLAEGHHCFLNSNFPSLSINFTETTVLDQGPNSWDSACQIQPLTPACQIKRHGKRQRNEIYYTS
jgi:hypothetical protein